MRWVNSQSMKLSDVLLSLPSQLGNSDLLLTCLALVHSSIHLLFLTTESQSESGTHLSGLTLSHGYTPVGSHRTFDRIPWPVVFETLIHITTLSIPLSDTNTKPNSSFLRLSPLGSCAAMVRRQIAKRFQSTVSDYAKFTTQ
jgi:hypothetical protein